LKEGFVLGEHLPHPWDLLVGEKKGGRGEGDGGFTREAYGLDSEEGCTGDTEFGGAGWVRMEWKERKEIEAYTKPSLIILQMQILVRSGILTL
jgi:hypothetical protein